MPVDELAGEGVGVLHEHPAQFLLALRAKARLDAVEAQRPLRLAVAVEHRGAHAPAALDDEAGRDARRLSAEELSLFERIGERRVVAAGELIFRRGELGRTMFVVVEGEVALEFGDGMRDKRIGPSEFFGELAFFIGNHARLASAVALGPCLLVAVSNGDFDALLEHEPAMIARFMRRSFAWISKVSEPALSRKPQLPSARPGVFMRLEASRPSRSWMGRMARLACDASASRMSDQWMSVPSVAR